MFFFGEAACQLAGLGWLPRPCTEKERLTLVAAWPAALKDAGRRVSSRPEKPGAVSAAGKGYASYDFVFSLQIKGQFMSV